VALKFNRKNGCNEFILRFYIYFFNIQTNIITRNDKDN
jgi:hypothetical protein